MRCRIVIAACLLVSLLPASLPAAAASDGRHYWMMDLISFAGRSAAEAFVGRLQQKGFHARLQGSEALGFMARSGPFDSLQEARRYRRKLRNATNLTERHMAIIGPFQADELTGWSIELFRYKARQPAQALLSRLKQHGWRGAVKPVDIHGRPFYQAILTGGGDRAAAEALGRALLQGQSIHSSNLSLLAPVLELQSDTLQSVTLQSANSHRKKAPVRLSAHEGESVVLKKTPELRRPVAAIAASKVAHIAGRTAPDVVGHRNDDAEKQGASLLPQWHIYGSDTIRSDIYNSKGNLSASPYRFSSAQTYDELSLNIDRAFSPFNRVTGQISGLLYNDSQYRSPFPGMVLERLNLRQENGGFAIPYRAELGDFFAFQSYRTIQRSLKGGRIEFQPQWHAGGFRHSIELFGGSATPSWDTFQYKDDFSSGGSWLIQQPLLGAFSANLAFNHKQANGFAQPASQQYVSSLAWEKHGAGLGQKVTIEAEAGRFIGDHAAIGLLNSGRKRQGNGYFGQISGVFDALPQLSYRIRGEAYEQDYAPNGASIQSDRTSQEGYLTWRDRSGLAIAARFQHYHTGWQTANPADTITYGGNISGVIPLFGGISGNIDAFLTGTENRNLTSNSVAKSVNASLSKSLSPNLSVRTGFFYSNNRDRNNAISGRSATMQFTGGVDYRFQAGGFSGSLSPGFTARRLQQQPNRGRWDYTPTLNSNLIYGHHQLSLALSKLDQSSPVVTGGVDTMTAGLNYRYTEQKFTFGLDANWYDRQPDLAATGWTNAWRFGAYLTYNFDKPVVKVAMAEPETVSDVSSTPSIERMLIDITRLMPGMAIKDANAIIAAAGMGAPTDQAGLKIWYARIFRDMIENQRLVLQTQAGRIARAAVVLNFTDPNDIAGMRTAFERMRRQLLSVYGQPDNFFDQGDFGPNLSVKLAAGRFVRVMEWQQNGGVLRFGIPRRLDGAIRMELQFARRFTGLKDTLWSMEQVQ